MAKAAVLIAEDNSDLRLLLHMVLESEGFEVTTAEDGDMALQALSQTHPDVLLTDLMMPKVDGIELIRRVRQWEEYIDLPIVAMSAYGSDHLAKAAMNGATATIRKPLDVDGLVSTIYQVLPGYSATEH